MGKKINPKILRLNTVTEHTSKWYAPKRKFADYLRQDVIIRKAVKKKLRDGGVSRVEIRRSNQKLDVMIATSKPGVIIGRSGAGVEELKRFIKHEFFGSEKVTIGIEIQEVRRPDIDAELVMQNIANQLEKRIPFRRAMKRAIESVMSAGAKGVKIICSGRLNGVEIARTETLVQGSVPTHTLRADIDYARGAAHTIYGSIGIKVWIYRGQVFADTKRQQQAERENNRRPQRNRNAGRNNRDNRTPREQSKKRTIVKANKPKSEATTVTE